MPSLAQQQRSHLHETCVHSTGLLSAKGTSIDDSLSAPAFVPWNEVWRFPVTCGQAPCEIG